MPSPPPGAMELLIWIRERLLGVLNEELTSLGGGGCRDKQKGRREAGLSE
jgi:hypothetical protein